MFHALHGPNWIRRVEICRICGSSANIQLRDTLLVLDQSECAVLTPAQYFEATEGTARLHRLIVTPGEYRERQSFGRFLPRTFAGENPIAYCHAELVGIACISGCNVSFEMNQVLSRFGDLPRQVANLPTDVALLIDVNGA